MTKTILIVGMGLITNHCLAQQVTIDSLLKVLKSYSKEDTTKLNLLNDIAYAYSTVTPAKGLQVADEAIALATVMGNQIKLAASFSNKAVNYRALGNHSMALAMYTNALKMHEQMHNMIGVAKVMHNIGMMHSQTGDYYKALEYHNKSLSIFKALNDKPRMASSFNSIGVNYMYLTDYSKSLDYFFNALKVYDQLGDGTSPARANTLTNIGIIYKDLSNFPMAIEYHAKALKIYEATGDQQGIANVLGNIGTAYDHMNQSVKALKYYERAFAINTIIGNESRIASDLTNMAIIYNELKNYPKALDNLQKALSIYKDAGDKNSMAIALNQLGSLYAKAPASFLKQHNIAPSERFATALGYHKKALQLSVDAEALDRQKESWEFLSATYEAQKEYPDALHAYKQLSAVKDSILNDEKKQEITRMQLQFKFEKQEAALRADHEKKQAIANATINEQRIVKNALLGGSAIIVMGAFTSFVFYKRRRDSEDQKNEALFNVEVAETEMKALRLQMNPHFIFNSLNSISDYISRNNLVAADNYLTKFAKVMRMILEHSERKGVSLADDLKALELYMQLEALRLNNKFVYEINVDQTIDQENTLVPPLILQPFVENSIWHGMAKKNGEGMIIITIKKENEMLNCVVEDNGAGRSQPTGTTAVNTANRSLGMKITKARIDIINQIKNSNAAVELLDLTEGMRVVVRLPFETSF